MLAAERRAVKMLLDLVPNRLGLGLSSLLIAVVTIVSPEHVYTVLPTGAVVFSVLAVAVSRWATRACIETLERSLLARAVELDLSEVEDRSTRATALRTLRPALPSGGGSGGAPAPETASATDGTIEQIRTLRSGDRGRIVAALQAGGTLAPALVHHTIPLLAWDAVATAAGAALRTCAEEHVGELTDALLDANQPFAVRRRLARVLSVCVSQRAAEGLMRGLEDLRFEVRFHCGRSLAAIASKNPALRLDAEDVLACVRREVTVGRPVWEGQRLLQPVAAEELSFADEFLRDRGSQSLAHVFTLLSLILPVAPLQICYRALHADDRVLKSTSLEYLEGVLPPDIRDALWPFISDEPRVPGPVRPAEEILAQLVGSNNVLLNLEELRRRGVQRS